MVWRAVWLIGTSATRRIQRWLWPRLGWPVAATTASEAAAGARASTTRWLQRVSRRGEERVGTLGTWRARGSYWSERKSSGARGSPAMAMAGARCLRGRQLRHENEQGVGGETERSSRGLRRWPRGARGGPSGAESTGGELGRWRLKTTAVATLQGLPRCASRRGGRGGRGGSPGHFGGAREARWPRRTASVATAALGTRGREKQRRGRAREGVRGGRGGAWRRPGVAGEAREEAGGG